MFLDLAVSKSNVYVREKVDITIRLYSDWLDVESIELYRVPPEQLVMKQFDKRGISIETRNGVKYVVLEYAASLVALSAGEHRMEPIEMILDVVKPSSGDMEPNNELVNDNKLFYDRYIGSRGRRQVHLYSKPIIITAADIPDSGAPEGYDGAVGEYELSVDLRLSGQGQEGAAEAVIVLSGAGNFEMVRPPRISPISGAVLGELDIQKEQDRITVKQGIKNETSFDIVVSEVKFSYFSPLKTSYVTLRRGPFVLKGPSKSFQEVAVPSSSAQEPPEKDSEEVRHEMVLAPATAILPFSRVLPERCYRGGLFILLALFPFMLSAVAIGYGYRQKYLDMHPAYAARLRALQRARKRLAVARAAMNGKDSALFAGHLFAALSLYLTDRSVAGPGETIVAMTGQMVRSGVSPEAALRMAVIMRGCYMAMYGQARYSPEEERDMYSRASEIIGELDKTHY